MLRRTYLGLEIRREGLRAVAVQRRGRGIALLGGQTLELSEGVLCTVAQEPNILKPDAFIQALHEVLLPLARREERIAVALPDAAGHVFLLDIETPFKTRSEGEEMVRWRLKEKLPQGFSRFALDYQVLAERESGSRRVLVSVMDQAVLGQYEKVIQDAGYAPALIDFHALNLYSCYRSRMDLGSDFVLVGVNGNQLSLLAFANRQLDFYRVKTVPREPERIFQEINRSIVGYRRAHASFAHSKIHLHSDWEEVGELSEAVRSAFDRDIDPLPSPFKHLAGPSQLTISAARACSMAAALGVAERMVPRVSQ